MNLRLALADGTNQRRRLRCVRHNFQPAVAWAFIAGMAEFLLPAAALRSRLGRVAVVYTPVD